MLFDHDDYHYDALIKKRWNADMYNDSGKISLSAYRFICSSAKGR